MKLGVVGHEQAKFTSHTEALARLAIVSAIEMFKPAALVSGHCPLGGVDIFAEEIAALHGLQMIVHAPKTFSWNGAEGYKARNLRIAADSDIVLCVALRVLPESFGGMRFDDCYHCKGRIAAHVKGGGCWTAWQGRDQMWALITPDEEPIFIHPKGTTEMAFKQTVATSTKPAEPQQKKPGGRFSGIRPKQASEMPLLKAGDYIFDFVKIGKNRTSSGLVLDGVVVETDPAWPECTPQGQTGRFFLNFGEYSDEQLVSLAMALCDCETAEALEAEEPDYDILLDACSGVSTAEMYRKPGENTPAFGVNPAAGIRILLKLRDNKKGTLDKNGEPFRNAYFERCPDEYKKYDPIPF